MLSYLCLPLIAVQHCGPRVMPFVVSFKWLTTAPEIFWQLIHLLLISCTWRLYSKKKTKKVFHATECEKGTKDQKWARVLHCLNTQRLRSETLIDSFLFPRSFSGCVWCFRRVTSVLSDTSFLTLFGVCDASLLFFFSFFLICVQYRGRPVFAWELLFCCLWCGDTIASCRSARRESFFFVYFLGGTKNSRWYSNVSAALMQ